MPISIQSPYSSKLPVIPEIIKLNNAIRSCWTRTFVATFSRIRPTLQHSVSDAALSIERCLVARYLSESAKLIQDALNRQSCARLKLLR